jgi:hypothetical protein
MRVVVRVHEQDTVHRPPHAFFRVALPAGEESGVECDGRPSELHACNQLVDNPEEEEEQKERERT